MVLIISFLQVQSQTTKLFVILQIAEHQIDVLLHLTQKLLIRKTFAIHTFS